MPVEDTQKQAADSSQFPWDKHLTSVKIAMAKKNDALAEELLSVLLDVAQHLQVDDQLRLDLLARMGHVELHTKGAQAARRRFDETLKLAQQQGLIEHPSVAYCLDGLADCYEWNLEYSRAEAVRKNALSIAERALGAEHQHTKMLKERLNTLRQQRHPELYGSHLKTVFDELMERAAAPVPPADGQTEDKTAESVSIVMFDKYMTNARKELTQKNWSEAENNLRLASEKTGAFRKDDARRYDCLRMLASVMIEAGQVAEARKWYEKALTQAFENIGPYCEETAKCMSLLGDLFMSQDDIVNAKNYYQQALSAYHSSVGLEHASATQQKYDNLIARIKEERKWQGWSV